MRGRGVVGARVRTPLYVIVLGVVLAAGLVTPARVSAQSGVATGASSARGPVLNWVRLPGAETCIGPVELADRVERRLGKAVFVRTNDAIVVIEGRVGPAAVGGYTTVLRVSDPDGTLYGTRELSVPGSDCHELDELVALVIAITIRHDGSSGIQLPDTIATQLDALFASEPTTLDPAELPAQPATQADSAAHTQSPATSEATAPAASPSTLRIGLEAGVSIETGIQPSTAFAGNVRVYATARAIGSIALSGTASVPQHDSQSTQGSGRLEHRLIAGALALCPPAFAFWLSELSFCGELRVGQLSVDASGFLTERGVTRQLWIEAVPRVLLRTQLIGPTHALLAAGLPIRLRRPSFSYLDDRGDAHDALTPATLGVELELALGVSF